MFPKVGLEILATPAIGQISYRQRPRLLVPCTWGRAGRRSRGRVPSHEHSGGGVRPTLLAALRHGPRFDVVGLREHVDDRASPPPLAGPPDPALVAVGAGRLAAE